MLFCLGLKRGEIRRGFLEEKVNWTSVARESILGHAHAGGLTGSIE